jgi:hypothetical protein
MTLKILIHIAFIIISKTIHENLKEIKIVNDKKITPGKDSKSYFKVYLNCSHRCAQTLAYPSIELQSKIIFESFILSNV